MVMHEFPGPPQSAFALQLLHAAATLAYGCSFGSSSMPWMPYIVLNPTLVALSSRSSSSALSVRGRCRLDESVSMSLAMKDSTVSGVAAFENDVVVMMSTFLPFLFGLFLNAWPIMYVSHASATTIWYLLAMSATSMSE